MPFSLTLGADQDNANSAFVATFQAYLAGSSPSGDGPVSFVASLAILGEADLGSTGVLSPRTDGPPPTIGTFLGGIVDFVGTLESILPTPPVPNYGPIGAPTIGAQITPFPPVLGFDADSTNAAFVSTFQGYLLPQSESYQFLLQLAGVIVSDPTPAALGSILQNDPGSSYAQLDGQFDVFVGQSLPPFTTIRLPRLAFGPFINLSGLTYQIELDAFAKFGLTQIQYRLYASDQSTPPFNVISLTGLNTYVTNLVSTLGNAAANLHADAILTDSFGNVSTLSVVRFGIPDTQAPTAPPFLYISQLPDGTWLFVWGASSDNFAIDHYQIDQVDSNGNPIGALATGVRQNYYTLTGISVAGNRYRVIAFDPALNVSPSSPIATAVANVAAEPQISNVLAHQVPGSGTVQVSWLVNPTGTPCTAVVVDGLDRPLSDAIVSANGHATLTLSGPITAGIYRVRVGTS